MGYTLGPRPNFCARWETVEPEEPVYTESEVCYDEPSVNELIDMEYGYEFDWQML